MTIKALAKYIEKRPGESAKDYLLTPLLTERAYVNALQYSGYIFDLDGTIYLSERLIPGAREVIEKLKGFSKKIVFLSNKPLQTREDYAAKLTRLGIPTAADEVINSSRVMAKWLAKQAPGAVIYVIGEPSLIDEMARGGIPDQ